MAIDKDISALLPEPPPPRPARREAAIEEALRRFDARAEEQAPTTPAGARPARARETWGRPQIAALASVTLVVLVSVPIWWAQKDRFVPSSSQAEPAVSQNPPVAVSTAERRAPQPDAVVNPKPAAAERTDSSPPEADAPPSEIQPQAMIPPPVPATSPDARPQRVAAEEVAGDTAAGQVSDRTQGAVAASPAASSARSETGIVVTGTRKVRRDAESVSAITTVAESAASRGDWNACTILDPRRDASACSALADPSVRGAPGRAAAQLADGLTLAWQGNLDRAIDAFDRAIRADPDLSIAYLNRGLAYRSKGDLRRALIDFNRAVAREPDGARAYYHRSLLHSARRDTSRAEADAERAIELDPGYRAVLP